MKKVIVYILLLIFLSACSDKPSNSPHHAKEADTNTSFTVFTASPKTLDPVRSYSSDEVQFTGQIYEPLFQYNFIKRPYELETLTAKVMPEPRYLNAEHQLLPTGAPAKDIAYSVYTLEIKPGIQYQPHPAFAKDAAGRYRYHQLSEEQVDDVYELKDFKNTGSRELTAADYVYQIKRLAHPGLHSPILSIMKDYIVGLAEYNKLLGVEYDKHQKEKGEDVFFDLRKFPLEGVKETGRYTFQITLKGKYPQFKYWLAMPFFAPVPWEAEAFYQQPGLDDKNITLSWYPVGTGAYMMTENNPNRRMVLSRNPNFHEEYHPQTNERLPMVEKFVFSLEKESIPNWTKFLQGYYDHSSISSDNFDQAVKVDRFGNPHLTPDLRDKNIQLSVSHEPSIFYFAFNMLDPVVGGYSKQAQKLRQAISIVIDYDEYISIFMNGRGVPAQGPIPNGIFGYKPGVAGRNPYVYNEVNGRLQRKTINEAKVLLSEAGYPDGRNSKTGQQLILYYDIASNGNAESKSHFAWMRKQFAKLGIQLHIRSVQYNQFQEKVREGNVQMFSWGWNADYPDPENFLFLLYGPNGKAKFGGENAANYSNAEFDRLYDQMKNMPNGPARQLVIDKMVELLRADAVWAFGFNPQSFRLSHSWNRVKKPNAMANNTLKYSQLNPEQRKQARKKWNEPIWWPVWVIISLVLFFVCLLVFKYWQREKSSSLEK